MRVLLHSLESDPDGEHFTFCLQLGETAPITYRVTVETDNDSRGATHLNSDDGSFEKLIQQLGEIAEKENLRRGAYYGPLLMLIFEQYQKYEERYRQPPLCFPVEVNASDGNPSRRTWSERVWAGVDKASRHSRPVRAHRTEVV
jgi:hypothetical protein